MTQFSESNDRFEGDNTIEHHAVCDEQQSDSKRKSWIKTSIGQEIGCYKSMVL